jgi:gamma-glutamyltranspeptidase/glutathione hydrolase
MAFDSGGPRFVFGAMGGDGQPQANVQVLQQLLSGADAAHAVAAPRILHGRFLLEDDEETLHVEADIGEETLASLSRSGHHVEVTAPNDERMGHAHAIAIGRHGSLCAGSDPRSDGAAVVLGDAR